MKPPIETIRISKQGRDQLLKLKRNTKIDNWNILCRWALCVSLKEKSPPPLSAPKSDGGIEMSWKVFAGEYSDILSALCWVRLHSDGIGQHGDAAAQYVRAHLHRGLSYLAAGSDARSIADLANRWFSEGAKGR